MKAFIFGLPALAILSFSTMSLAKQNIVNELQSCNSLGCMTTRMQTNLIKNQNMAKSAGLGNDHRFIIISWGCRSLSYVPDMFLGGFRGAWLSIKTLGLATEDEVESQCLMRAADFLDKNDELEFSLAKQMALSKVVCSISPRKNDEKSKFEATVRESFCYESLIRHQAERPTALEQNLSELIKDCGTSIATSTAHLSAEEFLFKRGVCIQDQVRAAGTARP